MWRSRSRVPAVGRTFHQPTNYQIRFQRPTSPEFHFIYNSTLPKLQTISLVEDATLHTPKLKLLLLEKNVAGIYFARDNGFPLWTTLDVVKLLDDIHNMIFCVLWFSTFNKLDVASLSGNNQMMIFCVFWFSALNKSNSWPIYKIIFWKMYCFFFNWTRGLTCR